MKTPDRGRLRRRGRATRGQETQQAFVVLYRRVYTGNSMRKPHRQGMA